MTPFRFIHSSDLHLGRRFGMIPEDFRPRLVEARHKAINGLAHAARKHEASHILIAGDMFDTETPSEKVWRQALAAMDAVDGLRWWIIPGNHDSLTAEPLWDSVRRHGPAAVRIIDAMEPITIAPGVSLLPSPALRRYSNCDLTDWMPGCSTPEGHLRIGLAHGSVITFGADDDGAETIPPDRATSAGLDYLALGDWHGALCIGPRTWYSGAPERDRFKHPGRGVCLAVTLPGPGREPDVRKKEIGQFHWSEVSLPLTPTLDAAHAFAAALQSDRAARRDTLLRIRASGWISLPQRMELERAARDVAPEFGYFDFDDSEMKTECALEDLDGIATGGALRVAAEALLGKTSDTTRSATDQRIAAAALRRLYGFVTKEAR